MKENINYSLTIHRSGGKISHLAALVNILCESREDSKCILDFFRLPRDEDLH